MCLALLDASSIEILDQINLLFIWWLSVVRQLALDHFAQIVTRVKHLARG